MSDKNTAKPKRSSKAVHAGHRERMRKRFALTGFDGWSKHEVLEFMLYDVFTRQNTNEIAHDLLSRCGNSISRLFDNAQTECLMDVEGVGEKTVRYLRVQKAFMEYCRSEMMKERSIQLTRDNFTQVLEFVEFPSDTEDILLICLDRYLRVKYVTRITEASSGGQASTTAERLVRSAAASGAKNVVLVHNHPSGCDRASYEDMVMTSNAERLLRQFDIDLIDHFIVCGDEIVSVKSAMADEIDKNPNSEISV